jgi:hypothetical protein
VRPSWSERCDRFKLGVGEVGEGPAAFKDGPHAGCRGSSSRAAGPRTGLVRSRRSLPMTARALRVAGQDDRFIESGRNASLSAASV